MRNDLVSLYLDLRRGRLSKNDEGNIKGRYRLDSMPEGYEAVELSQAETKAGQYMRRIRRRANSR